MSLFLQIQIVFDFSDNIIARHIFEIFQVFQLYRQDDILLFCLEDILSFFNLPIIFISFNKIFMFSFCTRIES